MYNIIFTLDKVAHEALGANEEQIEQFKSLGAEWYGTIPEFREYNGQVGIQADSPSLEVIEAIKQALTGANAQVIGIWNKETGEQVSEFNSTLYLNMLADEVSHDEDGNETSRQRPTMKQVNKWAGQVERNIS